MEINQSFLIDDLFFNSERLESPPQSSVLIDAMAIFTARREYEPLFTPRESPLEFSWTRR